MTKYDSLRHCITQLRLYNLHRLYVVDGNDNPIGVVGVKEILSEIINS